MKIRFYFFLIFTGFLVLNCSEDKGGDTYLPTENSLIRYEINNSNEPQLLGQAFSIEDFGTTYFYGVENPTDVLPNLTSLAYRGLNSETTYFLILDDSSRVKEVYTETNGIKDSQVYQYTYPEENLANFITKNRNWDTGEETIVEFSTVNMEGDEFVGTTLLSRDSNSWGTVSGWVITAALIAIAAVVGYTIAELYGTMYAIGAALIWTGAAFADEVPQNNIDSNAPNPPIITQDICENSNMEIIIGIDPGNVITAIVNGNSSEYTFYWSTGETATTLIGHTITAVNNDPIYLLVIDDNGCSAFTSVITDNGSLNSDAAAIRAILEANGTDVSDPRWVSSNESELIDVIQENGVALNVLNSRVNILRMEQLNLSIIPDEIGDLAMLEFLYLNNNQITQVSNSIGNLSNLRFLELYGNGLSEIPNGIGNLSNLNYLGLHYNQLTSLPESIGNLSNLNYLVLHYNQLTSLPESIGNLSNLTLLVFQNNQFSTFPNIVTSLTNLTDLSFRDNSLTELPNSIGNLQNLTNLDFTGNNLTGLPDSIGNLVNLTGISLYNNSLTSVPSSVGNLINLNGLSFNDNPDLKCLPQEVWDLQDIISGFIGYSGTQISGFGDTDCSN